MVIVVLHLKVDGANETHLQEYGDMALGTVKRTLSEAAIEYKK